MTRRIEDRLRPITPQLAWRVAILGAIAFVLFATVFFRLWSLQVLSGSRFEAIAKSNGRRELPIEAPRGDIVDRDNHKLVTTRPSSRNWRSSALLRASASKRARSAAESAAW